MKINFFKSVLFALLAFQACKKDDSNQKNRGNKSFEVADSQSNKNQIEQSGHEKNDDDKGKKNDDELKRELKKEDDGNAHRDEANQSEKEKSLHQNFPYLGTWKTVKIKKNKKSERFKEGNEPFFKFSQLNDGRVFYEFLDFEQSKHKKFYSASFLKKIEINEELKESGINGDVFASIEYEDLLVNGIAGDGKVFYDYKFKNLKFDDSIKYKKFVVINSSDNGKLDITFYLGLEKQKFYLKKSDEKNFSEIIKSFPKLPNIELGFKETILKLNKNDILKIIDGSWEISDTNNNENNFINSRIKINYFKSETVDILSEDKGKIKLEKFNITNEKFLLDDNIVVFELRKTKLCDFNEFSLEVSCNTTDPLKSPHLLAVHILPNNKILMRYFNHIPNEKEYTNYYVRNGVVYNYKFYFKAEDFDFLEILKKHYDLVKEKIKLNINDF